MTDQPYLDFSDGGQIPQLGFGVFQTPADVTAEVVRTAFADGYRMIDTASAYRNERGVGEGLKASGLARDEVFITTKLFNSDQGYDKALAAFDTSLQRLGLETVDLYLIHWPAPTQNLYAESWKALVRIKEEGRARHIGVSNFLPEHLNRVAGETGVWPVLNQVELHPRFPQAELRAFHAEHDIVTESWSPLGRASFLTDPVLGAIAAKHGKTAAQVVIRWHLDLGLCVIPKSVTPSRIAENFQVFDFSLDEADLAAIGGLASETGRIGPNPANLG